MSTPTPPFAFTLRHMRTLSFEELALHFKDKALMSRLSDSLRDVLGACARWHPTPEPRPMPKFSMVLATYLIALHSDMVFEVDTDETRALTASAVAITDHFDLLITDRGDNIPRLRQSCANFHERLLEHDGLFSAWTTRNSQPLVDRIHQILRSALVQLLELSPDAEVDQTNPTALRLRTRIEELRGHLSSLSGGDVALGSFDTFSARMYEARHASRVSRGADAQQ